MLKNGNFIRIKYSKELLMRDLCELVTRNAMVTRVTNGGAYVLPLSGRLKGQNIFIPNSSIQSQVELRQLRANEVVRHTLL